MFNFRYGFVLFLTLFSGGVFANNYYYWTIEFVGGSFPSADAAISHYRSLATNSTFTLEITQPTFRLYRANNGSTVTISRNGSSCPPDTEYDSISGGCLAPDPEPEPDQCQAGDDVSTNKFFPNGYIANLPPNLCVLSCQYSRKSVDQCAGPYAQGNRVGNSCRVTYTGTGDPCSAGDPLPAGDPDAPPETPENPDCRVFVNADGSYGMDCNPRPDESDNSCPAGYMLQGTTCFRIPPEHPDYDPDKDPNKPPTDGEGDGEGDPDGDADGNAKDSSLKDIGTKIDTTNTKLTGIDSKIGTSNTLLQGIKDAIGKIPGGGGSGNGDGDGEGEDESAASGLGCTQDLECTGDPIQCATLRINKEHLCQTQLTSEAEQQIKAVFEGEENELQTKEVSVDSVFTDGLNAARWLPSTCPTPETVTVFGRSYSISWQPLCTFASALSALIVALASIFFIVYLGKGLKGS